MEQQPSGEREEEAGKKDKGRSDEGIYPILAGVAAGCRAQEGAGGSLIGSLPTGIDRKGGRVRERERVRKRGREGGKIGREHGVHGADSSSIRVKPLSAWPP